MTDTALTPGSPEPDLLLVATRQVVAIEQTTPGKTEPGSVEPGALERWARWGWPSRW